MKNPSLPGPGLVKTRGHRLFLRRAMEMWASVPGAMAAFVRGADVVSEGSVRDERGARTYYGSTSLLFRPDPQRAATSAADLHAHLAVDPHFRLLAIRVAVREAAHRAGAEMGSVAADITFREVDRGLAVIIDITAPIEVTGALRLGA